jgi:site-specific DNA-methyltransferase (adenine-specific)
MSEHRVILADCLGPEGLATLRDRSADVFLMDPPYSERVHRRLGKEGRKDGVASRAALTFGHLTPEVAQAVAREACRIARYWIVVFCDELSFGEWVFAIERAGGEYVRKGTWVKEDAMPQMSGDRPGAGTEEIVIAHAPRPPKSGRLRWNGGGKPATYRGNCQEPGVERFHPAQKPLWLMEALVRDFTQPGATVIDPFAGAASTLVACKRLGRSGIGWEADPHWHAIATKRIDGTREQLRFFEGDGRAAGEGAGR